MGLTQEIYTKNGTDVKLKVIDLQGNSAPEPPLLVTTAVIRSSKAPASKESFPFLECPAIPFFLVCILCIRPLLFPLLLRCNVSRFRFNLLGHRIGQERDRRHFSKIRRKPPISWISGTKT